MIQRAVFCCAMLFAAVLAYGQSSGITGLVTDPSGAVEAGISEIAPNKVTFAAPRPPSALQGAVSMLEMEERLSLLEQNRRADQEEMERLRAEIQSLKSAWAHAAAPTGNQESDGTHSMVVSLQPSLSSGGPTPVPSAPAEPSQQIARAGTRNLDNFIESVLPGVKLSSTIWLYDYKPFRLAGARSVFDLYGAHLKFDRDGDRLGFHLEYRMRTTKLRSFFTGPTWLQEGYLKVKLPGGALKVGEMYKQFGIFTDYSFYGGLPYFDGLKYDPEWGASFEGTNPVNDRISLEHAVQYFRTDSRVNGSLTGRDVVSDPTGRRRNELVSRLVPHLKLNDKTSLAVGPSFEVGKVSRAGVDQNTYWRIGGEATVDFGPVKLYGEVIRQNFDGRRFPDLPKVTYGTLGLNMNINSWLSTHLNYGQGNYDSPGRRKEYLMQPGLVFTLGNGYAVYLEYTYWVQRASARVSSILDRSLNTAFSITF